MELAVLAPAPDTKRMARRPPPEAQVKASIDVRHVIFFLDDALPHDLLARMERAPAEVTLAETLASLCRFHGSCALGHPWNAKSITDALRTRDGRDYRLLTWRVLPNHVHVLLEAAPGWPLGDPIHRWKLASSPRRKGVPRPGLHRFGPDRLRPRALRLERPRPDEFWADEDFELILDTQEDVEDAKRLIAAIAPPDRRAAPPAPSEAPEPPAEAPEPIISPPPQVGALSRSAAWARLSGAGARPAKRPNDWLGEIARCVVDLASLYGAFFLVLWLVGLVRHGLEHWGLNH